MAEPANPFLEVEVGAAGSPLPIHPTSLPANMTAYGGQGFAAGGAGTIYTKSNNAQFGQVVVDGGGAPGATTLTVLPGFSTTADLTITGGAKVGRFKHQQTVRA